MTPTVSPEMLTQALIERVRILEAQSRRWKTASFAAVLAVVLILGASLANGVLAQGNPPPTPQTLSAQSFELKDSSGNIRGRLSMKSERPVLELYDQTGKVIWTTSAQARNAFSSELR
jgi:hypothetical protein